MAGQYAQRLALAVASIQVQLARVPAAREFVIRDLGSVRHALEDRRGELRWRAEVIAATHSAGVFTMSPLLLDGLLADPATIGPYYQPFGHRELPAGLGSVWLREVGCLEPGQVAAAFATIGEERSQELATEYPHFVGSLDGAPPELRYRSNRILIAAEIARLEDAAVKLGSQAATGTPAGVVLRRLLERSSEYQRWLDEGRQVLLFDPEGDGRVVEVFGDLGTASAIGVLVPGMANDIENFSAPSGGCRFNAANLFAATSRQEVATIAWLGYDTPDGVDAVSRAAAVAGAPYLARFLAGLDPYGEDRITVVAHSYGSVLTGIAAADGIEADNVVFVGSPGTTLDRATDAQLRPGGRVWAALADNDPIAIGVNPLESTRWLWWPHLTVPVAGAFSPLLQRQALWHGVNPVAADFGALLISTDGSSGHSAYFQAGTLENLAAILEGRYSSVDFAD